MVVFFPDGILRPAARDRWPRDPSGYHVPHDVLAAEAFPMPVPDRGGAMPPDAPRNLLRMLIILAGVGAVARVVRRRQRATAI